MKIVNAPQVAQGVLRGLLDEHQDALFAVGLGYFNRYRKPTYVSGSGDLQTIVEASKKTGTSIVGGNGKDIVLIRKGDMIEIPLETGYDLVPDTLLYEISLSKSFFRFQHENRSIDVLLRVQGHAGQPQVQQELYTPRIAIYLADTLNRKEDIAPKKELWWASPLSSEDGLFVFSDNGSTSIIFNREFAEVGKDRSREGYGYQIGTLD